MSSAPQGIVLKRHRDLVGRRHEIWIRRSLLVLVGLIPLAALFNLFGQRPHVEAVESSVARLSLYAPSRLRGGLIWEGRFTIDARRELKRATLVLDRGWGEGNTINTIAPSPIGEGSSDGRLTLELGHVPAGQEYLLFMQFQVNPTNVGRRSQAVRLYDGDELLLVLNRRVTVFP